MHFTLVGSHMRIGNFISSPGWSFVALSKYSNQKLNSSSSSITLSLFRLNCFIKVIFPIVDFRYQLGGFNLNIHSHAWKSFYCQFHNIRSKVLLTFWTIWVPPELLWCSFLPEQIFQKTSQHPNSLRGRSEPLSSRWGCWGCCRSSRAPCCPGSCDRTPPTGWQD